MAPTASMDCCARKDARGELPLHLLMKNWRADSLGVLILLLDCYPDATHTEDAKHRVPLELALEHGCVSLGSRNSE